MVGERAAQLLASRFGSMDKLLAATSRDINEIHGIGPQIAQSVTPSSPNPTTGTPSPASAAREW
jgi:DNA ligase (NAD+)